MKKILLSMFACFFTMVNADQTPSITDYLRQAGSEYLQKAGTDYLKSNLPESLSGLGDLLTSKTTTPAPSAQQDHVLLNAIINKLAELGDYDAIKVVVDSAQSQKILLDLAAAAKSAQTELSKLKDALNYAKMSGKTAEAAYLESKLDNFEKIIKLLEVPSTNNANAGVLSSFLKQLGY